MNVKDKNIIVTGGSLGIGKETALNLIEKGANVLVTGRSFERLKKPFNNSSVKFLEFDIGDIPNITDNAKKCLQLLDNRVDILINNAGTGFRRSIDELKIEDFLERYIIQTFLVYLYLQKRLCRL